MNEQLKKMVEANGLAAVLAGLTMVVRDEQRDLEEMETEADAKTAEEMGEVVSLMVQAARKYDGLTAAV